MVSKLSRKGQVTIPQALRQQLGLMPGQPLAFNLSANASCITLRPVASARPLPAKGFGMVKVKGPHFPAECDPGQWLIP